MIGRSCACAGMLLLAACSMPFGGSSPDSYARLDDSDIAMAAGTMRSTLEEAPDGHSRSWNNPATGHAGMITPVASYVTEGGYFCRTYREQVTVGPDSASFEHDACRDDDGQWVWL